MKGFGKRYARPGASPGTLVARADPDLETAFHVMRFGPDGCEEDRPADVDGALGWLDGDGLTWIDVTGLGDVGALERLGARLDLHPLALEDVLNTGQRPKAEEYEGHLFVVLRHLHLRPRLEAEQVSLFQGERFVVTFQERPGDAFEPVRERIRAGSGKIRRLGSDYLAYALVDAVVDHLFPVLEAIGERLVELEEEMVEAPAHGTLEALHAVKKELLLLRKAVWPLREVVGALVREDNERVGRETRVYLRDCYDHAIQLLDLVETYRDLASGLMDLYLSSVSQRMNEVMKVLTMMATIFIPLSFVAGIYGMNFNREAGPWSMPELDWYWGYPLVWLVMAAIAGGLLLLFRRKGWL